MKACPKAIPWGTLPVRRKSHRFGVELLFVHRLNRQRLVLELGELIPQQFTDALP